MAAEARRRVVELFSSRKGPFTVQEITDQAGLSSIAQVNVIIYELLRQGVLEQTSAAPPAWKFCCLLTPEILHGAGVCEGTVQQCSVIKWVA